MESRVNANLSVGLLGLTSDSGFAYWRAKLHDLYKELKCESLYFYLLGGIICK